MEIKIEPDILRFFKEIAEAHNTTVENEIELALKTYQLIQLLSTDDQTTILSFFIKLNETNNQNHG